MKKILVGLAALTLLVPAVVFGAELKFRDSYSLGKSETLETNLYYAGQGVSIYGTVVGDVVAAGGIVDIQGDVAGSVLAAGGTININGNVNGSVRVAGGTVNVNGIVGGDLVAAGGQINVAPDAFIKGDLLLGGGNVSMQGTVDGKIKSGGRQVTLNGTVKGPVDLSVENLTLGPKAVLASGLTYHSNTEAQVDPAAKVTGGINFDRQSGRGNAPKKAIGALLGFWALIKLIGLFLLAILFAQVFPKKSREVVHSALTEFWPNLGKGFAFLILAPIVGIILFVTLIGIPVGLLVFLVYFGAMIVGSVFATLLAGALIEKYFMKREPVLNWLTAVFGAVVLIILSFIPFLGWLVSFGIFLAALGGVTGLLRRTWWAER